MTPPLSIKSMHIKLAQMIKNVPTFKFKKQKKKIARKNHKKIVDQHFFNVVLETCCSLHNRLHKYASCPYAIFIFMQILSIPFSHFLLQFLSNGMLCSKAVSHRFDQSLIFLISVLYLNLSHLQRKQTIIAHLRCRPVLIDVCIFLEF